MKNFQKLSFMTLAILVFSLFGCTQNTPSSPSTKLDGLGIIFNVPLNVTFSNYCGTLHIGAGSVWRVGQDPQSSYDFSINSWVYNNSTSILPVGVGTLNGAGVSINPNANNFYTEDLISPTPVYGSQTYWSFAGNSNLGIPSFSDSLYASPLISVNVTNTTVSMSNTSGFTINWNADANNNIGVGILLSNSDRDSSYWHTIVPDNGSYTIPQSVLQKYAQDTRINVYVARVNFKKSTDANGREYIVQMHSSNQGILFVQP